MHCHLANNKAYALADLALVTFDDEAQLWGDSNVAQCTERLHQQGAHEVVVKLGADGCQYSKKHLDNSISVELFNTVAVEKVIDTTAAGDVVVDSLTCFRDNIYLLILSSFSL